MSRVVDNVTFNLPAVATVLNCLLVNKTNGKTWDGSAWSTVSEVSLDHATPSAHYVQAIEANAAGGDGRKLYRVVIPQAAVDACEGETIFVSAVDATSGDIEFEESVLLRDPQMHQWLDCADHFLVWYDENDAPIGANQTFTGWLYLPSNVGALGTTPGDNAFWAEDSEAELPASVAVSGSSNPRKFVLTFDNSELDATFYDVKLRTTINGIQTTTSKRILQRRVRNPATDSIINTANTDSVVSNDDANKAAIVTEITDYGDANWGPESGGATPQQVQDIIDAIPLRKIVSPSEASCDRC